MILDNMIKKLGILVLVALQSGCATQGIYESQLNAFVGKPIDTFIERGKIPTREYATPSGNRIYCFDMRAIMSAPVMMMPTQSISTVKGNNIYTTNFGGAVTGGGTMTLWCNTCFVTNSARKILRYNLEGNSCVSSN